MANIADDDEVLILHRLCIHPQYRGCGKFLIKQAIEIAKFLNQKAIRLDVLCTNKPAIYLYEKCGLIIKVLPPITEPSPTTVSPPNTLALE